MEQQIVGAIIASRKAYDALDGHFDPKKTLSPIGQFWYELVDEYFKRDPKAEHADLVVLRSMAESRLGSHKARDTILGLLDGIQAVDVSPSNVVASVLDLRRNTLCLELATAISGNKKQAAEKHFRELAEIWDAQTLTHDHVQHEDALEALFDRTDAAKRIRLLPGPLSERCGGGALPGHHIGVFGRTEVGKSTFVRNMCAGFVRDKRKTLYVANEDTLDAHRKMFLGRLIRKTQRDVAIMPSESIAKYRELGGPDYMRFVHMQPGSVEMIRKEVEAWEPQVLVIDQLRNLEDKNDGLTQKMEANAIRVRNLLAEYSLLGISIAQAGDRSSGHNADSPIWLSAGDVDSSRVGFPATLDLLLGIGGNNAMLARGQRAVSLCKNKLESSAKSREGFIVQVDLTTGVVE